MTTKFSKVAIASAISAAAVLAAAPASAKEDMEKCYGIALAGENDCHGGTIASCDGTSKVDYQGDAWKMVPAGTCESISVDGGRKGSLTPLDRDIPNT